VEVAGGNRRTQTSESSDTMEPDEWRKTYLDVLEKAQDDYVVNLDANI